MTTPFPMEKQQETNWCWAALGVSIKHYFWPHSKLEQCALASKILDIKIDCQKPPDNADQERPLDVVLKSIGAFDEFLPNQALSFDQIRQQIQAGRPVCVRIGWFGEDRGHFVVIAGYSVSQSGEGWVDVADPFFGHSTIPYEQFRYSYLDSGEWTDTYLVKKS